MKIGVAIGPNLSSNFYVIGCSRVSRAVKGMSQTSWPQFSKALVFSLEDPWSRYSAKFPTYSYRVTVLSSWIRWFVPDHKCHKMSLSCLWQCSSLQFLWLWDCGSSSSNSIARLCFSISWGHTNVFIYSKCFQLNISLVWFIVWIAWSVFQYVPII